MTTQVGRDQYNYGPPPGPAPVADTARGTDSAIRDLTEIRFILGQGGRSFDLTEILLMAADRLTTLTSAGTFQATIQNAIAQPDQPVDHKDVPPAILSELVILDVLTCSRIDPNPAGGAIRSYGSAPYNSYQLTTLGKAIVRALRTTQAARQRTEQLAMIYNQGKQLLLYEKDYANPPPAHTLGGMLYSDLVRDDFNKWDRPTQQFVRDNYGVAEATLYGNKGWPLAQGDTIFDIVRARLARLEDFLTQASDMSPANSQQPVASSQ